MNEKRLYKGLLDRDPKLDGRVFFGVKTTGIYCRSVCPARKPHFHNIVFFKTSLQAQDSGFRACLRCRPESKPGTPAWKGSLAAVSRAKRLIEGGVYDREGLIGLTRRTGLGDRHLRRLFKIHFKNSPRAFALEVRLNNTQKLVRRTNLSITEIAHSSGFKSLRRFNDAFKKRFKLSPTSLRRLQ